MDDDADGAQRDAEGIAFSGRGRSSEETEWPGSPQQQVQFKESVVSQQDMYGYTVGS